MTAVNADPSNMCVLTQPDSEGADLIKVCTSLRFLGGGTSEAHSSSVAGLHLQIGALKSTADMMVCGKCAPHLSRHRPGAGAYSIKLIKECCSQPFYERDP